MDIALLNVKITVEKNEVTVDEIGNRRNAWTEYYSCFATVGGEGGRETTVAGITVDDSDISFPFVIVRWHPLLITQSTASCLTEKSTTFYPLTT